MIYFNNGFILSNEISCFSTSRFACDNLIKNFFDSFCLRSPIVKDVTTGFAQISSTDRLTSAQSLAENKQSSLANTCATSGNQGSKLNPPLTILIPNISHHAIARRSTSNLQVPLMAVKKTKNYNYQLHPFGKFHLNFYFYLSFRVGQRA